MNMKKTICLIILTLVMLMLGNNDVYATGYDISATSYDAKVGDNVTINVNFTAATWDIVVSGDGITEGVYAGYTEDLSEKATSKTLSLNTSKAGTYTITMSGSITDANGTTTKINKVITIKVSETTTTAPEAPSTTTKSSEARLRDLGITPNDFKGFKRDTTTYNVEVPNNVSKVNVYAKPVDSNAKISGTGDVTLKEGLNTVNVVVTAEDGTKKTYTLNITRKAASDETEEESSEARLSNLGIRPKDYDFSGFKRDTTSYSVEVPNELEEVEIYAETVNSKAKVTGTGKVSLKEGKNTFEIEVTAEDGTKKTYTLEITRKEANSTVEPEETTKEVLGLTSLLVKDFNISPKFNTEIYEYTIGLTKDLSSLAIEAKANDGDATIEIIGNENLQQGENIITILVTNAETEESATYQIIVNKNVLQDEVEKVNWLKPSTWGLQQKIIVGVAVVLILVIIIAIIIKIKLSKSEDEELDLPGGEELDKALAEHQELAEDTDEYEQNEEDIDTFEEDADIDENETKSDIEKAQEYFESYSKRRGKHF